MSKFQLKIVTPRGIYKETEADLLNIKTAAGQIGILAHHIPLASAVEISEMNYVADGKRYPFAIGGGFLYVDDNNTVTIIGNSVESPEEIDLRRAEEAKKRAEEHLNRHSPDIDIMRAEVALKRAITRIHVKKNG